MKNPIDKLISDVSFPREGEMFGVVFIEKSREELVFDKDGGMAVKTMTMTDRSYRENIFVCIASDANRVVGKNMYGVSWVKEPKLFHRTEWRFDDVSALLPALGLVPVSGDNVVSIKRNDDEYRNQ